MVVGGGDTQRPDRFERRNYRTRRCIAVLLIGALTVLLVYGPRISSAASGASASGLQYQESQAVSSDTSSAQNFPADARTAIRTCVNCQIDNPSLTTGSSSEYNEPDVQPKQSP